MTKQVTDFTLSTGPWALCRRLSLQEKRAIAAGAKTAAICRLLRRVFGLPLYMRFITAFFVTTAIGKVFCSVLQRQDIKTTAIDLF